MGEYADVGTETDESALNAWLYLDVCGGNGGHKMHKIAQRTSTTLEGAKGALLDPERSHGTNG